MNKNKQTINGREIETRKDYCGDICTLEVEVGTNGYQGGDTGHGSRTYLRIQNDDCADIEGCEADKGRGFEVTLGGDGELTAFIDALEFAINTLKEQAGVEEVQNRILEAERSPKQMAFAAYLHDVVSLYKSTGKLKGITDVRAKYHVSGITKEQFYMLDLHNRTEEEIADSPAYCDAVYNYILGKGEKPVFRL